MNYGYARCSTNESKQDIHRQIKELKAAGSETIVFEYEHGDAKIKKELESLLEAAQYVQTIEHRQGLKVACLEEIAYQNGWIDKTLLLERAKAFGKTGYGQYLFKLAGERA